MPREASPRRQRQEALPPPAGVPPASRRPAPPDPPRTTQLSFVRDRRQSTVNHGSERSSRARSDRKTPRQL
ncbi:hypothetical protein B5X24_HaOG203017 [Helicoverpa armigera]|uniref:Uncharacterized protein n=1 Tax=Helicoverpa armigera TaxID=29058 RepID=A0A2W1C119_HELAM|nr:hypothetical protein B5X24_HaOG203017 [Helicoverpa armigera]